MRFCHSVYIKSIPLLLIVLSMGSFSRVFAQIPSQTSSGNSDFAKIDKQLEARLRVLVDSFHGTAGIYVRNLKTGKEAAINADTIFPTASIVKLPILIGIFDKIRQGAYTYHQPLRYRDSMARGGSGLMQYFKDSTETDLKTAITLMITQSDNAASVWCEKLAGGGIAINAWLAAHGFGNTRVNARTPGREGNKELYGWGQTTPREMADLLAMIRQGKAVSPEADETMYRILTHIFWDEYALSQIPRTASLHIFSGTNMLFLKYRLIYRRHPNREWWMIPGPRWCW
ncbi:serine hydrolase [Flavitalea flava]